MSRHSYNIECLCERCNKERERRAMQSKANRSIRRESKRYLEETLMDTPKVQYPKYGHKYTCLIKGDK